MNLDLTPEDSDFRDEVRAFLKDNLTDELAIAGRLSTSVFIEPEFSLPWQRILHARGWAAPGWPVEYGGTGALADGAEHGRSLHYRARHA